MLSVAGAARISVSAIDSTLNSLFNLYLFSLVTGMPAFEPGQKVTMSNFDDDLAR